MNAENAHDFIPLLQALGDGKIIQEDFFGEWSDLSDEISFNMKPEFYRIKPEPRNSTQRTKNTMSETPETDAFFWRKDIDWNKEVEFCCKMERERNEW